MSDIIKWAIVIVVWMGAVWVTGIILDKVWNRRAESRYQRDFTMMCLAVMEVIADKTRCDAKDFRNHIEWNISETIKGYSNEDLRKCYDSGDCLRFTYICAHKVAHDWEDELKAFCGSPRPVRKWEYLQREPKNNPYLVSFVVWAFIATIAITILTEYVL